MSKTKKVACDLCQKEISINGYHKHRDNTKCRLEQSMRHMRSIAYIKTGSQFKLLRYAGITLQEAYDGKFHKGKLLTCWWAPAWAVTIANQKNLPVDIRHTAIHIALLLESERQMIMSLVSLGGGSQLDSFLLGKVNGCCERGTRCLRRLAKNEWEAK